MNEGKFKKYNTPELTNDAPMITVISMYKGTTTIKNPKICKKNMSNVLCDKLINVLENNNYTLSVDMFLLKLFNVLIDDDYCIQKLIFSSTCKINGNQIIFLNLSLTDTIKQNARQTIQTDKLNTDKLNTDKLNTDKLNTDTVNNKKKLFSLNIMKKLQIVKNNVRYKLKIMK